VDQANAAIGVAVHNLGDPSLAQVLRAVQEKLFVVGGELASDEKGHNMLRVRVEEKDVAFLEGVIDLILNELDKKGCFVVPGKTVASAFLHVARTQVRFAERAILTYHQEAPVSPLVLKFINRLSDLLFVMARYEEEVVARDAPAIEQTDTTFLTLSEAKTLLDGAEAKAKALGVPMSLAVMDAHGNLIAFLRMDCALLGSIDIAQGKAYTAVAFRLNTEDLREAILPGAVLHGIENTNGGKVVPFGGGMPVKWQGRVIGALGVSGGTVEEDIAACQAGLLHLRRRDAL